jgi:hypothetical protein
MQKETTKEAWKRAQAQGPHLNPRMGTKLRLGSIKIKSRWMKTFLRREI